MLPTAAQALRIQAAYVTTADAASDPRSGVFALSTPELSIGSPAPTANADISVPSTGRDVDPAATTSLARAITQTSQLVALKNPPSSIGVWADSAPAERWITAAALGSGMRWGWKACWMARDLTAATDVKGVEGIDIRGLSSVPTSRAEDIPYLNQAWEHCVAENQPHTLRAAGFKDDQAVGIVTVFLHGDTSALFDLGVAEPHRKQGIGCALVEHACRLAAERGARTMTLNSTGAGRGVYTRCGFVELGEGQTFWLDPGPKPTEPGEKERALVQAVVVDDASAISASGLPRQRLRCGMTLVEIAAKTHSTAALKALTAAGLPLDVMSAWDLGMKDAAAAAARALGPRIDDLDEREDEQTTLLHKAVERDDPELVKLLLDAGASPEVKDGRFGSTPAGWGVVLGSKRAAEALEGRA